MNEKTQRFLAQHLVSLSGFYSPIINGQPSSDVKPFAFSGTIVAFKDVWTLLTAGHIIEDLDLLIQNRQILLRQCFLVDSFGYRSVSEIPIPFKYEDAMRAPLYVDGLDFGFIEIDVNCARLLSKNGITPITREHWINQDKINCAFHWMVGLPKQFVSLVPSDSPKLQVSVAIIPLNKIEPPDDVEPTKYPRFVAEIGADCPLQDIDGMSGGPILGFAKDAKSYWVVAIQSKWLPQRRIIFGCPLKTLAEITEAYLDSVDT